MKKTVKILYLPTEEIIKNHIVKHFKEGALLTINDTLIGKVVDSQVQIQHLYITVLQYVIGGKKVYYIDKFINKVTSSGGAEYGRRQNVIIATTDPKLMYLSNNGRVGYPYPQLQQPFLKEFVTNPDRKFKVEYENTGDRCVKHMFSRKECQMCTLFTPDNYRLKLNQDNTVNITAVKEKVYSIEEMLTYGNKAFRKGINEGFLGFPMFYTKPLDPNWIKKNL
jgi:hypothetical protein